MARSDLIISLVKAGADGNAAKFRRVVETLAADERKKQHHLLADRLVAQLRANGAVRNELARTTTTDVSRFVTETIPSKPLSGLILPRSVEEAIGELVEEQQRADLLRAHGLEPRHRVLLAGPPGNGKTSLAEATADALMVPLLRVNYEQVIGSYLGETANRMGQVFEYARQRHCVLFFDEFDAIGKERGDVHETGEIKRVVSTLLLQIDELPSHVVVMTASNHPELLDRAVWRRFQLRLELPQPRQKQVEEWFRRLSQRLDAPLGRSPRSLAQSLRGLSFAELEDFSQDLARRLVLEAPDAEPETIVAQRLKQWGERYSPGSPESL